MKSQTDGFASGSTRRDFIRTAAQTAAVVASADLLAPRVYGQGRDHRVAIMSDPDDGLSAEKPVRWAVERFQDRLKGRGISVELRSSLDQVAAGTTCVVVGGRTSKLARRMLGAAWLSVPDVPEATGMVRSKLGARTALLATGSDVRGLVYAVLELADRCATVMIRWLSCSKTTESSRSRPTAFGASGVCSPAIPTTRSGFTTRRSGPNTSRR